MAITLRAISAAENLQLRQKILRPMQTEAECVYPGDELPTTFHFGLLENEKIIGVSTFMFEAHPDFAAKHPYRLRGMAIDNAYQGQKLGQRLLGHGIDFLVAQNCDFIWFNARVVAFPFYEKFGFQYYGPQFDIKFAGPHKVMYKYMNPR